MTAGAETTVETMATRLTNDCSLAPSSHAPTEMGTRLPDYREPPLGFFEGGVGGAGAHTGNLGSGPPQCGQANTASLGLGM